MIRVFKPESQGYRFYSLMGPFFADLIIAKELERQVYNKPNTEWFLAMSCGDVVGFASVCKTRNHYFIDNLYVLPQFRNINVATDIISEIVWRHAKDVLKCNVCNPYAMSIFCKHGFVEEGNIGKYKKLVKR